MTTHTFVEYADASPEVRAVYDDIMATRKRIGSIILEGARQRSRNAPATWESIKQIMAPGELDPLIKEMIYIGVSVTNQCPYCIARTRRLHAKKE